MLTPIQKKKSCSHRTSFFCLFVVVAVQKEKKNNRKAGGTAKSEHEICRANKRERPAGEKQKTEERQKQSIKGKSHPNNKTDMFSEPRTTAALQHQLRTTEKTVVKNLKLIHNNEPSRAASTTHLSEHQRIEEFCTAAQASSDVSDVQKPKVFFLFQQKQF